ncbi:hypothetical protein RJ639_023978 [Escallonia herrerae]|uniref:EF-hand domain-containing protein n=1 Tax=Escallonia herrerae TaxID=1293975 RepID=A0AA88V2C6_9ASTE|nr:hypothetical protein RJ639_023978 [Escallonia herrerae]
MATNGRPPGYLEDIDEVKRVFDRFDANGVGKISASELADITKSLGSDTSKEEISRMMEEFDTDHDGFINLEEFAGICKVGSGGTADDGGLKELHDALELYDQDKDGRISAAELYQNLNRLGERCSIEECAEMIKSIDSDGDGFVSFEEFKRMMTNTKP